MASRDSIGPVLDELLSAASAALSVPAGRVERIPGNEPAWDDCCDGQLYIRLASLEPLVRQGVRSAAGPGCDVVGWAATIVLGIVRCAATLNDQGEPPSPAQVTDDSIVMTRDLSELESVVICSPHTWKVLRWQPLGVMGGCHGGEWWFTVRVGANAC